MNFGIFSTVPISINILNAASLALIPPERHDEEVGQPDEPALVSQRRQPVLC
jgi:hypothetical protein